MNDLHGIIFAYRQSPDLRELVQVRNSCSVPFGGRYRVIDFSLSNLVNAGVTDVGVIVHTSYQSLLDHVGSGKDWDLSRKHGGLRILPPFGFAGKHPDSQYRGRMDALAGVYSYLQGIRQDYVVLIPGDLAANLPLDEAFQQHLKSGADITAICVPKTGAEPRLTTYMAVDGDNKVTDISVHPSSPKGKPSLETYILSKSLLISLVDRCSAHDVYSFSQGALLHSLSDGLDIRVFEFQGYATRVQQVYGYFYCSMELLDPRIRSDLFRVDRPIRTKDQSNPSTYYGPDAKVANSLISDGCHVEGTVINSILARGVHVEKGAVVENCILLQRSAVQEGSTLRYAIADKNVRVCPGRTLMGHGTYPLVIAKDEII